ncbi:MAG: transcription termination/antitermination protein NusG [Erysipelotrichaceae bacterium]|nr:transcription termination/antitermination protein NusG [Erysipelotrichaceae bacterium]
MAENENIEHVGTSFNEGRRWYVVNTYSGHENKVKENLIKRVESMGLQDVLFNIVIPETVETVIETKKKKDGTEVTKKVNKVKNLWPGYVLVEMIMTDEAWYIVRNTSGVTGFIGSSGGGKKPFPVAQEEIEPILKMMGISSGVKIDFQVGDRVKIVSGPWVDKTGKVQSIDKEKEVATLLLDQMSATMEIDLLQLEKID